MTRARIGIINIMPKLEAYEPLLLGPLARTHVDVEPVLIRLETHSYQSSDHAHLDRHYVTFDTAIAAGPLDGLVLSGAPVEELPFSEVHYWPELQRILAYAREHIPTTLGLCWGGLALAQILGIPKQRYPQKIFGVYAHHPLVAHHPLLDTDGADFLCAHSRYAGIADWELQGAEEAGRVRLLARSPDAGYTLFETPDHRFVAHLGHPEYVADRLVFEFERDRELGRADVPPPANFDPARPTTSWAPHREALFDHWVALAAAGRVVASRAPVARAL